MKMLTRRQVLDYFVLNNADTQLQGYCWDLCEKIGIPKITINKTQEDHYARLEILHCFNFINIGSKFVVFNEDEAKWVIAHEIGHVFDNNNKFLDSRSPLRIHGIIILLFGLLAAACQIFWSQLNLSLIVFLSSLIICRKVSARWKQREYQADLFASKYVDKEIGIRALEKLGPDEYIIYRWIFGTHPLIKDRIQNLQ
ncbi:Hypothetical protein HVR_LOCUS416 [uncultured virus]|nr:Hypothetical protein HVR_LOCUS416 [uncultured virus]